MNTQDTQDTQETIPINIFIGQTFIGQIKTEKHVHTSEKHITEQIEDWFTKQKYPYDKFLVSWEYDFQSEVE